MTVSVCANGWKAICNMMHLVQVFTRFSSCTSSHKVFVCVRMSELVCDVCLRLFFVLLWPFQIVVIYFKAFYSKQA